MLRIASVALLGVVAAAGVANIQSSSWQGGRSTPIKQVRAPRGWILKADAQNYKQGPYVAFAGDWSVKTGVVKLRQGQDYSDNLVINPTTFPNGTVMHWQWPGHPPPSGVYGYLHIAYGNYAGGPTLQPVMPVQVANIGDVRTDYQVSIDGDPKQYNLLSETFLTGVPNGFSKARGLEVGFLPSVSANGRMFFEKSNQLGEWTDPGGKTWRAAIKGQYLMLIPADGAAMTQGTLYFGAVLRWLVAQGRLTGREWFNGLAIGIEPVQGDGSMTVANWRVSNMALGAMPGPGGGG